MAVQARRTTLRQAARLGFWLGAGALAFSGCAGDDAKRAVSAEAGEAGVGQGDAGDSSSAGASSAGTPAGGSNGNAGEASVGGGGGDGGAGASAHAIAPFGLLFSVSPGAEGVPATGVAEAAPDAASNLYASTGSGATHVQGTNTLGYTAEDLGLDPGDDLDAISAIHPADASAFYFSIVDQTAHDEGLEGSGVRRSSTTGEVQSDIFMTYGLAPLNGNGSNIEWVDEYRLGLTPETEGEPSPDDLNALDIDVPPGTTPLFFSVAPGSVGVAGSAVALASADELACTIFAANLDGTNEVAFTCAELGLVAGDDIDALVVLGAGDQPQTLLFSVTPDTVGAAGTAVAQQTGQAAADVFASDGTGTNTLYIEERSLGLLADDDLDALAIENRSPLRTWLPPPPEDPPPLDPPPCPRRETRERINERANDPVQNSLESEGAEIPQPQGKAIATSAEVLTLVSDDTDRINALQGCGTQRPVVTPGALGTRLQVICPAGATELQPGTYLIGAVETEEPLDFDDFTNVQVALIVDTDSDPANNYRAQAPYTFDTFDNTDRALQLQKNGNLLVVRAQDISKNPFRVIPNVADRIIIQGRRFIFIMQVDEASAFPLRFTVYGANGQTWTMSNVAHVGEPMERADVATCP